VLKSLVPLLIGVILSICVCGLSAAQVPDARAAIMFEREWIATSGTAMRATGDVWLTPTRITFDHRVTFELRHIAEVKQPPHPEWGWGKVQEFSLFEIVNPQPQAILNGNHLCGHPAYTNVVSLPRYLAIGFERRRVLELLILVYRTETPPDLDNPGTGHCGGLGYFSARSD
jgi:hypothetical protein